MVDPVVVRVRTDLDAAEASRSAREMAEALGLGSLAAVQVATAVSEVAMNIVRHAAGPGCVTLRATHGVQGSGVHVEAADPGPGIRDVGRALADGFSTGGTLGLGLPGARRLVDEFALDSQPGGRTTVTMVKWARPAVPEPSRLAAWAIAGPADDATPVVKAFAAGLLLAVVDPDLAPRLREEPERAVATFLDHGGAGAIAVLAARDGAVTWARTGHGDALRLTASPPARAPARRAQTGVVHRGDWLVLSSRELPAAAVAVHRAAAPGRVAAAAAEPDATVVAAQVLRGALERQARQ